MREFELSDFKTEVNENEKTAVFFYADWAAPSRSMNNSAEKAFEKAQDYYDGQDKKDGGFSCGAMPADDNKELLLILGVKVIPTICLIEKGVVVNKIEGYRSEKELTGDLMDFIDNV